MNQGHGDDLHNYPGLIRTNFSSNVYAGADLGDLRAHLARSLGAISNYPEPEPSTLERLLAEGGGVSPDNVMATSGATQAIYIIALWLSPGLDGKGLTHVIPQPTFSEYADACGAFGCRVLDGTDGTGTVFRECGRGGPDGTVHWACNPNNPTGSVIPAGDILEAARNRPGDIFVLDQSYEDYTAERMVGDAEAVMAGNMLVIHSMTKRYCVPGLRLGHVVASGRIIRRLKSFRPPWSVGALPMEAGIFLLKTGQRPLPPASWLVGEAGRLGGMLNAMEGISAMDTRTSFMLCRIEGGRAADLKDFLAREHGMLIRNASNFRGLDGSHFRVAAQAPAENDRLVSAIREYMERARK